MKKLLTFISLMLAVMMLLSSCSLILRPTPDGDGDGGDIGGNGGIGGSGEHVHAYGEWSTEIPPTCSSDGVEKAVCSCGDSITQPIPAVAHTFTEWSAANPPSGTPSCEWETIYTRICTSCGLTETKSDGVAPGHVWGEWSFVSSSATHDIYIRICKTCGNSEFKQEQIGGTGTHTHKWSQEYAITAFPTLDTNGSAYISCTDCGVVTVITLPYISESNYTISYGSCVYPYDQYTFTYYDNEIYNASYINISFSVYVDYLHDEAPVKEDCVITEGDNYIYYSYLCTKCMSYVVAYSEPIEGLRYTSIDDTTCYVSGVGNCKDEDIVIPEISPSGKTVVGIGQKAFYNCYWIDTIVIPDTVTYIEDSAFEGCSSIEGVVIPTSVTSIGARVFQYSWNLLEIYYMGSKEEWNKISIDFSGYDGDEWLYGNSSNFYSETKPTTEGNFWHYVDGVPTVWEKYVAEELAYQLSNDGTYYIVTGIGTYKGSELVIPSTYNSLPVKEIGEAAFRDCKQITSVIIPDSITTIGSNAFSLCYGLKTASIGNGVTYIGTSAFDCCHILTDIVLGTGKMTIIHHAFYECDVLSNIYYLGLDADWNGITMDPDGNYEFTHATVYYYSETQPTTDGNFWHYVDGVPTVLEACVAPENPAYSIGLEYTPNGDGNCYVSGIGTCTDTVLRIPPVAPDGKVIGVGDFAFNGCKSIVSVELPDTIVAIGYNAFYGCEALESINIPEGVFIIPWFTFVNCTSLESISLPKSLVQIEGCAFKNCTSLSTVYYGGNEVDWNAISIDSFETDNSYVASATRYYYSETEPTTEGNFWHYVDGKPVVWTIGGLFDANGNMLASWNDLVTKYGLDVETDLPMAYASTTTTSIAYIMNNNSEFASATKLVISGSVKRIGSWSLENKQLTTIEFAYGVTELGRFSLACCSSMVEIIIPDSVTTIAERAISFCNGLKIVTLPDSVTLIGNGAFYGCSSLESIVIPKSVTTIEYYAFNDCPLKNIYYLGNASEWANINNYNRPDINPNFENATVYYYCENLPTESGDFWHYVDGVPTIWKYYNDPNYSKGLKYSIIDDETCAVVGIGTCTDTDLIIPAIAPDGRFVVAIGTEQSSASLGYNTTSISIPSTVTNIYGWSILGCEQLKYITVDKNNEYYKSIDGNLYSKDGKTLIRYTHKGETEFDIPYGVTTIYSSAFYGMYNNTLKAVSIPDTVTEIEGGAFSYCTGIKSFEFPDGMTTLYGSMFHCCRMEYIVIPKSVTCIDGPIQLLSDDEWKIYYKGTEAEWKDVEILNLSYSSITSAVVYYYSSTPPTTDGNFWHYVNGVPTVWEADNTVYSQGLEFASNNNGTCYIKGIGSCTDSEIVIPMYSPAGETVVAIGFGAFMDCTGITSIIIPEGVTSISYQAFSGCSSLKKFVIPASMTYISSRTFSNCTALEEVVFVDPTGWRYDFAPISGDISAESLADPKTAVTTLNTSPISYSDLVKH